MNDPCSTIMPLLAEGIGPRYRVARFIARGGMGCVFEGFNTVLRARVALKVLDLDCANEVTVQRFEREGRVQARLNHPNIVRVYDSLETPRLHVLVMECVDGGSLKDALVTRPRLPLGEARRMGLQLLEALQCAHDEGIVHRDVKPGNILLRRGQALLADFGIASVADWDDGTLTEPGQSPGTPLYMSPEQATRGVVDRRSDLYSLALVLRQCITGTPEAGAKTPPRGAWRSVPTEVRTVIERALEPDPAARWQSAAEFRAALAKTAEPRAIRWRLALLALALALAGLVIGARSSAFHRWACGVTGRELFCGAPPPPYDLAVTPFAGADSTTATEFTRLLGTDLDWFGAKQLMPMTSTEAWIDSVRPAQRLKHPPGARLYTVGWLTRTGDSLAVEIDVIGAKDGKLVQRVRDRGRVAELQVLAHAMADSIICQTFERDCAVFRSIAFRPVNVKASAEFFAGKDSVARGNWRDGEQHFRNALQQDPGFMPAAWELMITKRFQREDHGADLQYIARNIDKVPQFYRRLAIASLTPDLRSRFRLLKAEVDSSRQNGTALLMYSNELFHRGALVGYPLAATLDTLRHMAATDPGMNHSSTYDMLWWGYMRLGLREEAEEALRNREALGLPPGDTYKAFQRLGLAARFSPWKAEVMRWFMLRDLDDKTLGLIHKFARLATMMDIPAEGIALGTILREKGLTNQQRGSALLGKAEGHMMFGRPGQAFVLLDSANAELESTELELQRREWAIHLFTLGLVNDTALVDASRAWLADSVPPGAARVRALYALGRDALFRGDTAGADSMLAILASAPDTTPTATRHATLLGAELVAARGDAQGALALTEVIYLRDTTTVRLSPFARAMTYLNRGWWQEKLRRHAGAEMEWLWHENADFEGWPMGVPQEGEVDAILSVYARLIRGEHAVKYGNFVVACRHLDRVHELWMNTEPVMAPFVARADRAIEVAGCR